MNNKNSFAYKFFMSLFLVFSFVKKNVSNICLGISAFLVLYYLYVVYGVNTSILGLSVELLLVSLTTSLPNKEDKSNNDKRYY